MGRFFLGLIGIAAGIGLALKRDYLVNSFGHMATIEKYMGTMGGTRAFLVILGVVVAIFSVLYMTGVFPGIIGTWIRAILGNG